MSKQTLEKLGNIFPGPVLAQLTNGEHEGEGNLAGALEAKTKKDSPTTSGSSPRVPARIVWPLHSRHRRGA